jgi:hypothetical protein
MAKRRVNTEIRTAIRRIVILLKDRGNEGTNQGNRPADDGKRFMAKLPGDFGWINPFPKVEPISGVSFENAITPPPCALKTKGWKNINVSRLKYQK